MTYLKNELIKLKYSKLNLFIYISVAFYIILLYSMYTYFDSGRSVFLFYFKVLSGLNYFMFILIPVAIISFLFSKEYEDRTMIYVLLRPTNILKLFFSKIIVTLKVMNKIIIISTVITFVYGLFVFQIEPLTITDTFLQSILKSTLYMLYIYICVLMNIGMSVLINVVVQRMVISGILSTIVGIFSSIITLRGTLFGIPFKMAISTLMSPASYYKVPFNDYLVMCGSFTLINIVVISILLLIAYRKYNTARGSE